LSVLSLIVLQRPFLHFETSDGYTKMSQAILEAEQEKEREAENQMPKKEKEQEEQTKAKVNINEENVTHKMREEQQRKRTEKG